MKAEQLKSIIKPENTALVVWDVQNMLVERIFDKQEFAERLGSLINAARKAKLPVFFTKITPLPDRFESAARKLAFRGGFSKAMKEDFELYFKPEEGDTVLNKHTASIFIGTPFDLMLNNAGIKNIVFAGIATEIGIESSARDALNRGYLPIIAKGCVSSSDKASHERSLLNMDKLMAIASSEEIEKALQ
ncbi:MAG: isochorismatase family cysteine hydrolase [Candidatus Micrarchaeia archaeon]